MRKRLLSVLLTLCIILSICVPAFAASCSEVGTGVVKRIYAAGSYINWDGVTPVAQFRGDNGGMYFAVDGDGSVTVYKTKNGKMLSGKVTLKKQYPTFGTVTCDTDGNFYLVTGRTATDQNNPVDTVFISKYDSKGNHIKTVGDNGSSSLASYYNSGFYTSIPFDAGCCDAAISGRLLSVNYAREMYSGHQSNSVFTVNIDTMAKVNVGTVFNSHSFSQRVVALPNGFTYMSEGDCYNRAFTSYSVAMSGNSVSKSNSGDIFDFWVEKGAFDEYDMYKINNNFACMGGIAALPDGRAAFAAQSVKSLNSNAKNESQEIFLQIFNPFADLKKASSYTTSGTRSGVAGKNGDQSVTDYGVKWLTSYGKNYKVSNVQTAVSDDGRIIVLYELNSLTDYQYKGIYYIVLNSDGAVLKEGHFTDTKAQLNPCEMPVFADGAVNWVCNRYNESTDGVYLCSLDIDAFPDVPKDEWYAAPVQYCVDHGFMKGYSNGKFGPADKLQRQDFVIILARIAGADLDEFANIPSSLSDIKTGQYYTAAINWAVKEKVISGYADGRFGVGDPITREQVAVILYGYMGRPDKGSESAISGFADKGKISAFAKDAMIWAVNNKVITGKDSKTLAPTDTASRAEIATIITRMDQKGMFNP